MIGVAVVGLGFGAEFVPIYRAHTDVGPVAIVDADPDRLADVGDRLGVDIRHRSLGAVLADDRIDAVHLLTPVAYHAQQAVAVLGAGRRWACAVPMADSLAGIDAVLAAQQASGRVYMMMETSVYAREYLAVRDLYTSGRLGEPTLYRASTYRTSTASRTTGGASRRWRT